MSLLDRLPGAHRFRGWRRTCLASLTARAARTGMGEGSRGVAEVLVADRVRLLGVPAKRACRRHHFGEQLGGLGSPARLGQRLHEPGCAPAHALELNPVEYLWANLEDVERPPARHHTVRGRRPRAARHRAGLRQHDLVAGFLTPNRGFLRPRDVSYPAKLEMVLPAGLASRSLAREGLV